MTAPEHDLFQWDLGEDGVVVVTLDDPTQSANTMNDRFVEQLPVPVDRSGARRARRRRDHVGQEDLLRRWRPRDAVRAGATTQPLATRRPPRSRRRCGGWRPSPSVAAAINGAALGGGYDRAGLPPPHRGGDAGVVVGLPEVMPGHARRGGKCRACSASRPRPDVLLTGRRFRAADALEKGPGRRGQESADLVPRSRWIHAHPGRRAAAGRPRLPDPGRRTGFRVDGAGAAGPGTVAQQTHGSPNPAARNLLSAVVEGAQVDVDSAQRIEARYFTELACGQISTRIVQTLLFDLQSLDRGAGRPRGTRPSGRRSRRARRRDDGRHRVRVREGRSRRRLHAR
ncbi:MAG: hypothetical protein U0R76_03205 [Candidatus Nanopelagicales bacterium]